MSVTVHRLLERTDLGLRPLAECPTSNDPITWVAATDLVDPIPFLTAGNIVLTTGQQFTDHDDAVIGAYVARLRSFGILAIGFGSNVVSEVPAALIDACEREQMPLFDVPYRTPFLAVIRYVADLVTAEAQERTVWAADAQRMISIAAIRPDGLAASVTELARRLGRTVTLFDARGHVLHAHPGAGHPRHVTQEAERMLARTVRAAGATLDGVLLQTVGRGRDLRGVLAVDGPLDHPAQSVVSAVIALAGMALERQRTLVDTDLRLRSGAWRCLVTGNVELAADLAGEPGIPPTFTIGMLRDDPLARAELTSRPDLFVARDEGLLVVIDADTSWAHRLHAEHGIPLGLSRSATSSSATEAAQEAQAALRRAERSDSITTFASVVDDGLRSLLAGDDAQSIARVLLEPIVHYDAEHASRLGASLEAWLRHNGQWDPAARPLGLHRHTLKAHVETAERVLERDLSDAETRAELLLALTLAAPQRPAITTRVRSRPANAEAPPSLAFAPAPPIA